MVAGEKNEKWRVRGKNEKREENDIKKGEKGLKNASFWVIYSKNSSSAYNTHM